MAVKIVTSNGQSVQSFEDWKNGGKSPNGSQQAASYSGPQIVNSSGQTIQSFEEWRQNRTSGVTPGGDTAITDWMHRYNRVMQGVSSYEKKRNGGFTQDASGGFGSEIDSLIADYDGIERYAADYGFRDAQKYLVQLKKLQNFIQGINDNFSQFEDEDTYNRYMEYWQDQEEKKNLDLDAYSREISALEQQLADYDPQIDWTDTNQRKQYDKGLQELEDEINRRKQYLTQAQRVQKKDADSKRFADIRNRDDFAENSGFDTGNQEIGYRYVNSDAGGRLDLEQQYGDPVRQFGGHGWDSLNEEEKQVYNYLMNTGDRQGAADYLRHLEESLQYRKGQEADAAMDALVAEDPKAKALRYAFMAGVGYDQHLAGMQGMGNMIAGKDGYVPASSTQVAGQLVREDLAGDGIQLPQWLGGGSTGQMVGDLISTTANMVPSILASRVAGMVGGPVASKVATGLMMGGSAGGSAYQEMINEGYSKEQARLYGLSIGAAEGALESLLGGISSLGGGGIANVTRWTENLDNALLNFALRLGGAGGSEALEEGLQEMISGWIKSEITHEDFWAKPADVLYSSLMGFLSGGMFEGPGIITDIGQQIAEGRNVLDSKGVAPLKEIAQTSTDQAVRKTAGKITDSSSAFAVGNLARKAQSEATKQNSADIAKSLTQKGMPEKAAKQYGEMLSYMLEAGSDTEIQRMVMESDPVVGQVLREAQMPDSAVYQRLQNMSAATGKARSIDRVAALYGKQAAAVKQIYNQGQQTDGTKQDVETFAYGFQRAFTVGRENGNVSAITEEVAPGLTQSQREQAYDLGRDAVAAEKAAISKRTTGTATAVHILNEDGSIGDEVRIAEISSRDGDSVTYVLEDGRTVSEDQLSFSGDNAVLDTVKELGLDVKTANTVIRGSKTITKADTLIAHGIDDAFRYGSHGYSLERLAKDSPFAALLTEEMRNAVYNAGKNTPATAQKKPPAVKVKTRGKNAGIYYDAGGGDVKAYRPKQFGKLEHKRESGVYAAQVLQKLGIGVDFYFFKSYVNKKGERVYLDDNGMEQKAPNGWYDPSDGSIHIDLNAGNDGQGLTLFTMAHELTHFIEQWSPEKYKVLADFLIQNYEKGRSMDELVLIKQQALSADRKKPVSYEEAYSEVIADSMEAMLADGSVMDKLRELKAQDSDLVARMKEFFDRMVKRITKYYHGLQPESEEGQLVLEMKDQFEQIQQLFAEALAEAGENFRVAQGIVDDFAKEYKQEHPGRMYQSRKRGEIPASLRSKLLQKKPISVSPKAWAKVKDARIDVYRGWDESDIPDIDFFPIAEYNQVNVGYLYTVRNYSRDSFAVLRRTRLKGQYEDYFREDNDGYPAQRTGAGDDQQGNSQTGRNDGNAMPGNRGTVSEAAERSQEGRLDEPGDGSGSGGTDRRERAVSKQTGSEKTERQFSDRKHPQKAPTFYSYMGTVVAGMKQEKFGAASVVNMLRGKGVKAEEIKWSGIEAWLEGKKSVTKAELQEFIAGSMLQIEEEVLTDAEIPYTQEQLNAISGYEKDRDVIAEELKAEWKRIVGEDIPITHFGAGLESVVVQHLLEANAAKRGNTAEGKAYKAARAAMQKVIEDGDHFFGFDNARQALRELLRNPNEFLRAYELTPEEEKAIHNVIKTKEAFSKVDGIPLQGQMLLKDIAERADAISRKIGRVKSDHYAEAAKYKTKYGSYILRGGSNYRELLFRVPGATYQNNPMNIHWDRSGVLAHARIQDLNTSLGKMLFIEEIQSDWHNEGHKSGYRITPDQVTVSNTSVQLIDGRYVLHYNGNSLDQSVSAAFADRRGFTEARIHEGLVRDFNKDAEWETKVPDAPFRNTYHEFVLKRLMREAAENGYDSIGWTPADIQSNRWSDEYAEGYRIEYDQDIPKFMSKYGKKWGTTVGKTILDNGTEVWSMPITQAMKDSVLYEGQVMYQARSAGTSNRALLAGAFEDLARSPAEMEFLQKYQENIGLLNEQEAKLQEIRTEIRELTFGKGPKDPKRLEQLQEEATKTANRINIYDKKLLQLEATVPLKRVLERERQKVKQKADADKKAAVAKVREETKAAIEGVQSEYEIMEREFLRLMRAYEKLSSDSAEKAKKAKKTIDQKQDTIDSYKADLATMEREFLRVMKGYETAERKANAFWEGEFKRLMREYEASGRKVDRLEAKLKAQRESIRSNVDSRRRTVLRNKIRKDIRELDKILNRGNKKRNVKQGMQDFVAQAIATGEILFADLDSDTDLIASGIQADMNETERKLLTEAERYVRQIAELEGNEAMADVLAARQKGLDEVLKQLQPVLQRERIRINSADASSAFDALVAAYESLQESPDTYIAAAFNPDALEYLRSVKHKFAGTLVKDMTQEQLQELHKCYKMVMTMIRDANKAFVDGRSVQADAEQLVQEFQQRKIPARKMGIVLRNLSNAVGWNYEKLYYALERINSPTLKRLYQNLADSENITMQDVQEAKAFQMEMVEKYHYNDWKTDQKMERTFLDNNGKEFHITLGELMALYAYSRREGADRHIEVGGFTFGKNALTDPEPASTYKLTADQVAAISNLLTPEQKSFAEAMQRYLSKTMGAKGNEVSMKLYGIEMFGEENYFPLHIAGEYKARAQESQAKAEAGFQSMTNAGFTKARNTNATAPIVLEGFMEVWVDHVNEMARYHGAVPALEDIRRVMNYSVYSDAMENSVSVKAAMTNAYGKQAVQYFDSLYREANSGAVTDKMDAVSKKLLSSFRKNSVAYSGSVVIQQPASIYRAMAIVAPKYFGQHGLFTLTGGVLRIFNRKKWNSTYADMMQYAPGVTMAKEIGGFDTSTGGSIRSYLLDTDKGFRQSMKNGTAAQKAGALLHVVDDNVIANLPNVADKIAWIEIWEACRRETVANNPKLATGSEAFKQKVGQRFTEVIRATQVYDSMFSKSPMLKSKNLAVQYVVSFMNEPNTVANMAENALRDILNKDLKTAGKTVGALATSIVVTNLLKSIVYAMRDDDEDETFREKYLSAVAGNLVSDVNLLNYIPYARDIWSLKEGYDVERADMAVVADAVNAITKLKKLNKEDVTRMTEEESEDWDKKVMDAQWKVAESLSPLAGIPLKNIRREVLAAINAVKIRELDKTRESTELSIRHAIEEATGQAERSDREKLYEAILAGDKVYTERLKAGYEDEDAYHAAIRKVLREKESRIWEAAIAWNRNDLAEYLRIGEEIVDEGHFEFDDIYSAIQTEANSMEESQGESASTVKGYFTNEKFGVALSQNNTGMADIIRKDLIDTKVANGKTREEAEESVRSTARTQLKELFDAGSITSAAAEKLLVRYGGYDHETSSGKVAEWQFEKDHPELDGRITYTQYKRWEADGKSRGVALDTFTEVAEYQDSGTSGSNRSQAEVADYINRIPISTAQKDALWCCFWKESTLYKNAPWH